MAYLWLYVFMPLMVFVGTVDVISYNKMDKGVALTGISARLSKVAYNQRQKTDTRGFWILHGLLLLVVFFTGPVIAFLPAVFMVWARNRLGKKTVKIWGNPPIPPTVA